MRQGGHLPELAPPKAENLVASARICFVNASEMLDDAKMLVSNQRFCRGYAISILAQEEFAKAFILCSCALQPRWDAEVWKALRDHAPKQAVLEVMERYANWFTQRNSFALQHNATALIPKPVPRMPAAAELASWLSEVKASVIKQRTIDRSKQEAFYVGIGRDGKVSSTPSCTGDQAAAQLQKAANFQLLTDQQLNVVVGHARGVGA
jgi:AbiV family abortive infection protein